MITETMDGVMWISLIRDSILGEKLGKDTIDELRVELENNFRDKHSYIKLLEGGSRNYSKKQTNKKNNKDKHEEVLVVGR